jgi:hypothetical protein
MRELGVSWGTLIGMQCTTPLTIVLPHFPQRGSFGPLINYDIWSSTPHGFITEPLCLCSEQNIFATIAYEEQDLIPCQNGNHLLSSVHPFEVWRGNVILSSMQPDDMVCRSICTHTLLTYCVQSRWPQNWLELVRFFLLRIRHHRSQNP